jgi:hypothetical protein
VTERSRQTIRDLLESRSDEPVAARPLELAQLEACLGDAGPVVAWVHGPSGTGKTQLLDEFARRAEAANAAVLRIDCQAVEPTAQGLLGALSELLDVQLDDSETAALELAGRGSRVVLAFDNYEAFRLADSWLRLEFIPALDAGSRVVLVSREPPAAGWVSAGYWQQFFVSIPLDRSMDVPPEERVSSLLDRVASNEIRRNLEALAVVRRITRPMLTALCPDDNADDLYEQLAGQSFIESRRDGLAIQETVSKVLAGRLQARDPESYRRYQQAAWKVLREQLREAPRADLWRCMADIIYLIENPVIREAFFPSESALYSIEPAMPTDLGDIMSLAEVHEPVAAVEALQLWWKHLPGAFHVVRDASGAVVGFYCMAKPEDLENDWMRFDPVARNWQEHLFSRGKQATVPALFLRRWLSQDTGEGPSAVQAAAWVDIKRSYLELRPQLRRVYLTLADIGPYGPAATQLGFTVLEDLTADFGDSSFHTAMLDFGPGSVDGWICDLVAAELGIVEDRLLDSAARELLLNGKRIPLTRLEYGVVAMLETRAGDAISRGELLRQVWGHGHEGGSNVVDAVVRGLRRKCGDQANMFETVRGVGYRLRV